MIDISHLRNFVVRPVLQYLNMWSEVSENLVVGTAIQESHATYLKQMGGGPALGIYQMEPATHDDIWKNYIAFRQPLADTMRGLMIARYTSVPLFLKTGAEEMIGNLFYATAMCRLRYKRVPEVIPETSLQGIAYYWKRWYNTPLGAGTEEEFINNYRKYNKG